MMKIKRKYSLGEKFRPNESEGDSVFVLFRKLAHSKLSSTPCIKATTLGNTPLNPSPMKYDIKNLSSKFRKYGINNTELKQPTRALKNVKTYNIKLYSTPLIIVFSE
ncbi:hypothetical protein ANTRET_LOCUS1076 [Anthophora retusa]